MLSTITVTSLSDNLTADGNVTLREAIQAANTNLSVDGSVAGDALGQDVIQFDGSLVGTIALDSALGQLAISSSVRIEGLGALKTTVDAKQNSRVFSVSSTAGDVALKNLTITGGKTTAANSVGGGIQFLSTGSLTIENSAITGNSTTGESARGGGLYSRSAVVSIINSTIADNSTTGGAASGGGLAIQLGSLSVTNSTVTGNTTSREGSRGAGIYLQQGPLTLTSSTVVGNTTSGTNAFGGGVASLRGNITLKNSIVASNTASGASNPDVDFANLSGTATFSSTNTFVGINQGTPLAGAPVGSPDVNGNLVGTVGSPINPMLSALANHGGSTKTFAPLPGSPVINAGGTNVLTTDQRGVGFSRTVGVAVDMGALEANFAKFDADSSSANEADGTVFLTVVLDAVVGHDVAIPYTISGSAVNPDDFTADATPLIIPAGSSSGKIKITLPDDALHEKNKTVVLTLGTPTNALLGAAKVHTLTINDDDAAPSVTLSRDPAAIVEDGGTSTITATLSEASGADTTITLAYSGSATKGSDYTASGMTIVIPAGELNGSITLTGIQDAVFENNEQIDVDIASVDEGTENGVQQVSVTILDPHLVTLAVDPASIAENGGVTTVTVTQSHVSAVDTTVTLAFSGKALIGTDYEASDVQVVIPAGSLSASITLTGKDDALYETAEDIIVDIDSVTNAAEDGTQQVTATITDDDSAPTVTLGAVPENFAEDGGASTITATLSAVSGLDTTVDLDFSGAAVLGTDYTSTGVQIVIPAGALSASVVLTGSSDAIYEADEDVFVDISGVTNGTEDGTQQVKATIIDDEAPPKVTLDVSPATFVEEGGTTTVTATLSAVSGLDTIVNLAYSGVAAHGTDYSGATQIVIPAGQQSASITLTGLDDAVYEPDEELTVEITDVINGTEVGSQLGSATIVDTPPTVTLSVDPAALAENGGVA
ncbi:MAG: Calx-beta domain-containing protein, partial [Planctomycetales bacterium]